MVRENDYCPQRIRSDRGEEVVMVADAQYALYCASLERTDADLEHDPPPLDACYLFGRSTQNQRIEI